MNNKKNTYTNTCKMPPAIHAQFAEHIPEQQPGSHSTCMCSLLLPQQTKSSSQTLCMLCPAHFVILGNTPVLRVKYSDFQGLANW